jgi:hypothetical protein
MGKKRVVREVLPPTTAAVLEADGLEFDTDAGMVMIAAPGLADLEEVTVQCDLGDGTWGEAYNPISPSNVALDASGPFAFLCGGLRFRVFKTATVASVGVYIQSVSAAGSNPGK